MSDGLNAPRTGINASRERLDVIRRVWETDDGGSQTRTTIRCNRLLLPLRNKKGEERVAVRGKSLTGTLRMGVSLLETFRTHGTVADAESVNAFRWDWSDSLSKYDTEMMPDNWISVYVNGGPVFSTADSMDMDGVERLAGGYSLRDEALAESVDLFKRDGEEVEFEYDSQLDVVLTNHERYVKCAILERNLVQDGTLSFAFNRKQTSRGTLIEAMQLTVNIVEASTLLRQHALLMSRSKRQQGEQLKRTREQIETTRNRVNELNTKIKVASQNNTIQFWPAAPPFTTTRNGFRPNGVGDGRSACTTAPVSPRL